MLESNNKQRAISFLAMKCVKTTKIFIQCWFWFIQFQLMKNIKFEHFWRKNVLLYDFTQIRLALGKYESLLSSEIRYLIHEKPFVYVREDDLLILYILIYYLFRCSKLLSNKLLTSEQRTLKTCKPGVPWEKINCLQFKMA